MGVLAFALGTACTGDYADERKAAGSRNGANGADPAGETGPVVCAIGWADCDGDAGNGCETDLQSAPESCGACGHSCVSANGTASCSAGVCVDPSAPLGCGEIELCDFDHVGFDDDCDGNVDEDCPCSDGEVHFCFKGDASYHGAPGCFDGTEKCSADGTWEPCLGGVHATDQCFLDDKLGCHPISSVPFATTDLKGGTGQFSDDAVAETWMVECPAGVSPCPGVGGESPTDDFKALQSGEYIVTYTKTLADGTTDACTYSLFVGARGLRIELDWEHDLGGLGVDLDLHVHQPGDLSPWSPMGFEPQDCGWQNCVFGSFAAAQPNDSTPHWFFGEAPPDPVSWFQDADDEMNSCYFAPKGIGKQWADLGKGCHSPRLDLDNTMCDPGVTNVDEPTFCAPENINIDFPPIGEWTRIAVHYYGTNGHSYAVHPRIRIFCGGAKAAELGPAGYYVPAAPVAFLQTNGDDPALGLFWLVADVAATKSPLVCKVSPLYADPVEKAPYMTNESVAEDAFGPDYPPP